MYMCVCPYSTVASSVVTVNVPSEEGPSEGLAPVIHQASATSGKCVCCAVCVCVCVCVCVRACVCVHLCVLHVHMLSEACTIDQFKERQHM